jgi:6-pyruvoyltetrahydropterin/6-carboxytetrahydropterin synthase
MHGHNYRVIVTVHAAELNELGMVCDFYDIKNAGRELIEEFDHTLINDHPDFKGRQPSTENLSEYFFKRLKPLLDKDNHWLYCIQVWENDSCSARYIRPQE